MGYPVLTPFLLSPRRLANLLAQPETDPARADRLQELIALLKADPVRAGRLEKALEEYQAKACWPLLRLPPADLGRVAEQVQSLAALAEEERIALVVAFREVFEADQDLAVVAGATAEVAEEFRGRAADLLPPNAVECFTLALAIHERAVAPFLKASAEVERLLASAVAPTLQSLWWASSCLDLLLITVMVYVEEDREPE